MATTKKGQVYYYEKKMVGSKWLSHFLQIQVNNDGSCDFTLYENKAALYVKGGKAVISKATIKACEPNKKNAHSSKGFGFKITTTKKKKYDFSCVI